MNFSFETLHWEKSNVRENQKTLFTVARSSTNFPMMLVAVRSKSVAPSSVQMALSSIVLPLPSGPARRTDLMWGVVSRKISDADVCGTDGV